MESHVDVPPQSVKNLWEPEALGSSPSCLPSWSPAQRLPSGYPNMKHCLEICVTLTEELGAVPPTSHSRMAPLMEDMLCDARTGLSKAVVTGPGRAVLFYGRHSMGKGLTADEARDATSYSQEQVHGFGKSAYLAADPMTIQEGRRAIAQAISNHQFKARGPGHPLVNLPAQQPLWFDPPRSSLPKDVSGDGGSDCSLSPIGPPEAGNVIGIRETKGPHHIGSLHLPQTMGLRATGVHYQWLYRCCLGLTSQTDPDVPHEVDSIEMKELTWR